MSRVSEIIDKAGVREFVDAYAPCAGAYASKKQGEEVVDHPKHYAGKNGIEAIDVIDAFNLNFNLGSAVKYILRLGKKDDEVTELEKAVWYLQREIQNIKSRRGI